MVYCQIWKKVTKIKDWPTPKTPKEVHSFVGLASYYRRFIPNFAKWAGPLHALIVPASFKPKIRKGEMKKSDLPEFQWTPACQEGFDQLKKALTEAPILAYPDYSKPFILETDASLKGLGAVLSQKGMTMKYMSSLMLVDLFDLLKNLCGILVWLKLNLWL